MRRKAEIIAPSDKGRWIDRMEGKTSSPPSDIGQTACKTSSACLDRGTSCGRRIFIRSAGMRHMDFSKLISARFERRTSPGREHVSAVNFNAAVIVGQPSQASIVFISWPNFVSSIMAARGVTIGRSSAPFKALVGSLVARSVTMA